MSANSAVVSLERPILACVGFCRESEAALLTAARLAESSQVPLVVLHVVHEPGGSPGYYRRTGGIDRLLPMDEIARQMLDAFLADAAARHPDQRGALDRATVRLVSGVPQTRIPEVARQIGAQLILMGSNGKGRLSSRLRRSMARDGSIPVRIVHADAEEWVPSSTDTPHAGHAAGTLAAH